MLVALRCVSAAFGAEHSALPSSAPTVLPISTRRVAAGARFPHLTPAEYLCLRLLGGVGDLYIM
jgi:hypothetical protein